MSLLPLLFSAWWAELQQPHILNDQYFGLGFRPDQLTGPHALQDSLFRYPAIYNRPWGLLLPQEGRGTSTITADKDHYQVMLDVQQFKPEEINVKVVDRFVVVEAKHEEKRDEHGTISRQFVRRYLMPNQVDIDRVESKLSSDGVLTITAPLLGEDKERTNERAIKIELTGQPALRERGEPECKGEQEEHCVKTPEGQEKVKEKKEDEKPADKAEEKTD